MQTNFSNCSSVNVCDCLLNNEVNCTLLVLCSGRGMYCLNTNRLRAASSIVQGKFVAARTKTVGLSFIERHEAPEARLLHCIRNSVCRRREASLSVSAPVEREESRESISSTK